MALPRLALACLLLLGLAALGTPTLARTLIETVNPDGSPVDPRPRTVEYNWSDHTPAGVMRGTWDIADDDPRLQPAPEGHPEQIALLYYGSDAVRVGWATGETGVGGRGAGGGVLRRRQRNLRCQTGAKLWEAASRVR